MSFIYFYLSSVGSAVMQPPPKRSAVSEFRMVSSLGPRQGLVNDVTQLRPQEIRVCVRARVRARICEMVR